MTALSAHAARPWVKVCGVTRPEDARLAAELGATFVGVNFWPRSPRCVEPSAAREIAAALRENAAGVAPSPALVGVFVNEAPGKIDDYVARVGLDLVQLHGDESDDVVARFGPRALRGVRANGAVADLLETCAGADGSRSGRPQRSFDAALEAGSLSLQWKVFAVVLDSGAVGERYGGSGERWEWARAHALCACSPTPILIAGGVAPETAAAALAASGAAGVDLASGVESAPGIKSREKMVRLFEEVRGGAS